MSIINKPDFKVFADEAKTSEIVTFPDILRGWGITLEQTAGKPPMEWFNALGKRVDEWLMYLTQCGITEWEPTLDYPKHALTQYAGNIYIALDENKNQRPDNSQQVWSLFADHIGLDKKLDKAAIVQTVGTLADKVMSQKAVTDAITESNKVLSVNGKTGDVTLTASDVDAVSAENGGTFKGSIVVNGQVASNSNVSYRLIYGNQGVFSHISGSEYYLLCTAPNDPYGTYNSLRPFKFNMTTGLVVIGNGLTVTGNATVSQLYVGTGRMTNDGNIYGSKWGNQWLDTYISSQLSTRGVKNTASNAANGWWRCGDTGAMIIHGTGTHNGTWQTITFPTAFPSNCFSVAMSVDGISDKPANYVIYVRNITRTQFTLFVSGIGTASFKYIARGN